MPKRYYKNGHVPRPLKSDSDTTANSSKENGCKVSADAAAQHAQTFTGTLSNCTALELLTVIVR